MTHCRDAPQDDSDREAFAHSKEVDDPADNQQADCICRGERKNDVAVVDLTPMIEVLKSRLENPDNLAVDVIDGGGEEQKRADRPAEATDPLLNSVLCYMAFNNRLSRIASFHESTGALGLRTAPMLAALRPSPKGSKDDIPEPRIQDDTRKAAGLYPDLSPGA